MNIKVRHTILKLSAEYVIVAAPILIYASLEALRHNDFTFLFKSPEWSIATIFLTIQANRIYLDEMHENGGRLFSILLILLLAAITLSAGINTYLALADTLNQPLGTMITKWGLFLLASIMFVYVAGAAIYAAEDHLCNKENR